VQTTQDVYKLFPLSEEGILEPAGALVEDLPIAAIKIGLLGSLEAVAAAATIIGWLPGVPVVLDPVLASGASGVPLGDDKLIDAIRTYLLPKVTLVTPNQHEALQLAEGSDSTHASGHALLTLGADYVLITNGDTDTEEPTITNHLFAGTRLMESFSWDRIDGKFHGTGCTLAASAAAMLAHGVDVFTAVHEAQEYTWNSIKEGFTPGKGQAIPYRLFWANDPE